MKVEKISLKDVEFGENNIRLVVGEEEIHALKRSMIRIGLIQPITVKKVGDKYEVIAGHRRTQAAKELNWSYIDAIVKDEEPQKEAEICLTENLTRMELSPMEISARIEQLSGEKKYTLEEIAQMCNHSKEWVRRYWAITQWPAELQSAVHNRLLSIAAAENLAVIPDETYRNFLIRNAVESGATARTTAAWRQGYESMVPAEAAVELEGAASIGVSQPMIPQIPCMICGGVFRMDAVTHAPICVSCCNDLRNAQDRMQN